MRWTFIDLANHTEQTERATIVAKIDSWWKEFQKERGEVDAAFTRNPKGRFCDSGTLADWMHVHLGAVDPKLMWEFGPALKCDGHRLVITPESAHHLRPLVKAILKRAPQIQSWEFYPYRLAESVDATHSTVQARTGLRSEDFQVRLSRGEFNRVDVFYFSPQLADADDEAAVHAAFVATETLLGEERLDKWVGTIEIKPLKKPSALGSLFGRGGDDTKHLIPLDRMKETFDAVVQSIRDQLPAEPHLKWCNEESPCNVLELKPKEMASYPDRTDLFVAITSNLPMWQAAHRVPFFSERFSRCGETFCYLKVDGSEGLDGCEFGDREEIENAIDAVLKPAGLGCVFGGGTGRIHAYSDLALIDLARGIQAIRKRLRAGKLPKRSWIQFFDDNYACEWVGIYDDTPPPPMPRFED